MAFRGSPLSCHWHHTRSLLSKGWIWPQASPLVSACRFLQVCLLPKLFCCKESELNKSGSKDESHSIRLGFRAP